MFKEHQPVLAEHARTSPAHFAQLMVFAIATQNWHFGKCQSKLAELQTYGLDDAPSWTKSQKTGVHAAYAHATHWAQQTLFNDSPLRAIKALVECPSIGIVKAAFIRQMACGDVGTLDRHWIRHLGLDHDAFSRVPTSCESLTTRIQSYLTLCEQAGGSAVLWDGWCTRIAALYPAHFANAWHVSKYHVDCVMQDVATDDAQGN
jgi:hypothetical protein